MERSEPAWVGLGANEGAARSTMTVAVAAVRRLPGATVTAVSRLYRTRPVGPVPQPDFLNAVVGLRVPAGADPAAGAMALLVHLKGIEHALGRVERERWGPRELDLDLLLFGSHRIRVPRWQAARSAEIGKTGVQWLEVPHPDAVRRSFVLAPLADVAPDLQPPGWGQSVAQALESARRREGDDAVRAVAAWDDAMACWQDLPAAGPGKLAP